MFVIVCTPASMVSSACFRRNRICCVWLGYDSDEGEMEKDVLEDVSLEPLQIGTIVIHAIVVLLTGAMLCAIVMSRCNREEGDCPC